MYCRSSITLSICAGVILTAQEPKPPAGQSADQQLQELQDLLNVKIVSASKFAQGSGDAPATVVVITQDQIRQRGYRSLHEVFQDLPDFKVESRSDVEWYNDYTVRGVPGHDKFVILLDGQKISGPTNERLPIMENFPVSMVSQIEVVYGPASALYGADAVSGVINLITAPAWNASQASIHGDNNGYRLANFFYGVVLPGQFELSFSGQWSQDDQPDLAKTWPEYQDFGPQRAGTFQSIFGAVTPNNYDAKAAYPNRTRAFYASLKKEGLRATLFTNYARFSSSSNNTPNNAIYNENVFVGHGETSFGLSHTMDLGSVSLQSSLSTQEYSLDPGSNFRNAFTGFKPGFKYADSSATKAEEQLVWKAMESLTVTGGLSYEAFRSMPWSTDLQSPVDTGGAIKGTILGTPIPADFFPLRYHNTGVYAQAQEAFTPTFSITLGARYDDNSRYGSTFNPRLGAVWHLTSSQTLKVLYGSAFLAPSPYTAFGHYGSFFPIGGGNYASAFWKLPNPGLKPMKTKNLELNYRVFMLPELSLTLTAYQTKLDNLFAVVDDSTYTHLYNGQYKGYSVGYIAVYTNLGEQKNHGGTAQLDFLKQLGADRRVSAFLSLSVVDGKVDPLGDGKEYEIGQISPQTIRAGVEGGWGSWSLSTRYTHLDDQRHTVLDPTTNRRKTLPGYSNLDLNLRWEFLKGITAEVRATNATDGKYRNINPAYDPLNPVEMFGAPQDPRRIYLGIEAKF
jgi:outer membrane receptor for ferrienterochelin and colicin